MIIDFHTHIFPEKIAEKALDSLAKRSNTMPNTDGTLKGLLSSMERNEINCSVVLPVVTNPKHTVQMNDVAIQTNELSQQADSKPVHQIDVNDRYVISFGGMHPDFEDYKTELKRIKDRGVKGIKLHPNYQDTYIDDIRYLRIIDCAASLDLAISIHAGIDIGLPEPIYCSPDRILNVWKQVQPDKLILAHTGGWKMWDEVEAKLVGLPVYFDTAFTFGFIKEEQMKRIITNHGSDRILFATDSPWNDQGKDVKALKALHLASEVEESILWKNGANILS